MDLNQILNVPVVFGLERQGHIPVIEQMLSEGYDWNKIGTKIGWEPATAREYYERYAQERNSVRTIWGPVYPTAKDEDLVNVCPVLAKAVEILKKYKNKPEIESWESQELSRVIYQAEKHLLSTPNKK